MKKTILTGALALAVSGTAMADAINHFDFDVFSSDDKMYVCNVGIKHLDGTIGYTDEVTMAGANSGPTASTHDYLTFDYQTLDSDMILGPLSTGVIEADGTAFFKSAFDDVGNAMMHKISNVAFNLNSEQYGTHYYVDVCYRGSQKDYGKYGIETDYKLTQNALMYSALDTTSSHEPNGSTLDYLTQAGIGVKSYTVCDTQLEGTHQLPGNGLDNWAFPDIDLVTPGNSDSSFEGMLVDFSTGTMMANWTGWEDSGDDLLGPSLNGDGAAGFLAPRYCVTRYEIWETGPELEPVVVTLANIEGQCNTADGYIDGFDFTGVFGLDIGYDSGVAGYDHTANGGVKTFANCMALNTSLTHNHVWRPSDNPFTAQQAADFLAGLQLNGEAPRDWRVLGGTFSLWTEISNVGVNDDYVAPVPMEI